MGIRRWTVRPANETDDEWDDSLVPEWRTLPGRQVVEGGQAFAVGIFIGEGEGGERQEGPQCGFHAPVMPRRWDFFHFA